MKKTLGDLVKTESVDVAPRDTKSFGAFIDVDGTQAKIDLEKLRKCEIFLATPCYGGLLTDQYFLSMFRLSQVLMKYGIPFRITTLRNESLITRARNILSAMFMESSSTHLFFIDADIEFQPESVLRALAFDKEIVVGAYPKKTLPINYAVNFKFQDLERKQIKVENGLIELLDASTGFFCVKREVFDKLREAYPEMHYRNDSNLDPKYEKFCYAFFDTGIDKATARYLSEDYFFCRIAQQLGIQIWLDPNTKLNHVGSYTFEGDVSKIISFKGNK